MISRKALDENRIVINPGRVLDNNNAHEMLEAISAAQTQGYKYVIVDMTGLEFLSSAGVGSILGTVETSRETGGDIILCNASEKVLRILKVLDLCDYLTIKSSEETSKLFCLAED